jgi:hypothetical protein
VDAAVAADSEAAARAARAMAQARLAETRSRAMQTLPGDIRSDQFLGAELEQIAFRRKTGIWWIGGISLSIIGLAVYLAMNQGLLKLGKPPSEPAAPEATAAPAVAAPPAPNPVAAPPPEPPATASEAAPTAPAPVEAAPAKPKAKAKARPKSAPERSSATRTPRAEAKPKAKPGVIVRDSPF